MMGVFSFSTEVHCLVWNEEFILPSFMNHYRERFGATFVFYDNGSTDRTVELAKDFGAKVLTYDTKGLLHDGAYLMIKNDVYRKGWKQSNSYFVIIVDADEFLEIDFPIRHDYTIMNVRGYDMVGDLNSRLGVHNPMFNKACMFQPKYIQEINYAPGCHKCAPVGNINGSKEVAKLLHRKYVSPELLYDKHTAYEHRLSKFNKERGFGIEYNDVTEEKIKKKFDELTASAYNIDEYHERNFNQDRSQKH